MYDVCMQYEKTPSTVRRGYEFRREKRTGHDTKGQELPSECTDTDRDTDTGRHPFLTYDGYLDDNYQGESHERD